MNLDKARAIALFYQELIEAIPKDQIPLPKNTYTKFTHADIDTMYLEDGYLTVKWSQYRGCGESDRAETNVSLDELFDY